ncbi:MAG: Sua5/YciO/YrdC/YwlC family protein, partial [Ginsengibacter sp.]
ILYPTDTIWGIGCDATDTVAIQKIFLLKKRDEKKSMIILLAQKKEISNYVSGPSKKILGALEESKKPITGIFENAINLPASLINEDGSIAIRIVKDDFCKKLIERIRVPLVATSANISGDSYPSNFTEISAEIKNGVDYIVQHSKNDSKIFQPSSIIKLNDEGDIEKIR